jgi:exopolysaccharide biosynthesis protein
MGGFVLHTAETLEKVPTPVIYQDFNDCVFGIQVGSSSVKEGVVMKGFESSFYNIYKDPVPYPPTLYPLDYEKARAPRMAICSDAEGKPAIVWSEGPSKLYYQKGVDSCGTSLLELGEYCRSIGLVNVLNMDGGGSAEIFLNGKLHMHVSDRLPDNSDAERPVPMGLIIR